MTAHSVATVVLDVNGTLLEQGEYHHVEVLAARLGVVTSLVEEIVSELAADFEHGLIDPSERMRQIVLHCYRGRHPKPFVDKDELRRIEVEACLAAVRLYPGATDALARIKTAGYKRGICSNANAIGVAVADQFGLIAAVDEALFSCKVGACKPDHQIYLALTDALGVMPEECLYVGDGNDHELHGAREVGMRTLRVHPWLHSTADDPDLATHETIETIAQVADYVLALL